MTSKNKKRIETYFESIAKDQKRKVKKETSLKPHFMRLVREMLSDRKGHLTEEYGEKTIRNRNISYDARLVRLDELELGLIEAKDDKDDLQKEITNKMEAGYRKENILFWQPQGVRLLQEGKPVAYRGQDFIDLSFDNPKRADDLHGILEIFLDYQPPVMAEFRSRQELFLHKLQDQANQLKKAIEEASGTDPEDFHIAFTKLQEIFGEALDAKLTLADITDWAIQHFFMRAVFKKVFESDFLDTNSIAKPLEDLLRATASQQGKRTIDDLWTVNEAKAIYNDLSASASHLNDEAQKQHFLNSMYERFFKDYSQKSADRFGVVYTPVEVVEFMLATIDHLLKSEFGFNEGLSTRDVKIIDPFVGTGNFLVHLIKQISLPNLAYKYAHDLYANEIQLMPYYISHVNLADAYWSRIKEKPEFHNLALTDTFDLLEEKQLSLFAEGAANSQVIRRQQRAGITVILGNPPYNVGQQKEDQNNKNKRHKLLDSLVQRDYSKTSLATNKSSLSDVYVKAFRWATERLKDQDKGLVAFITNNGFLEGQALDGMRESLLRDYAKVYVVNLKGNRRKQENPLGNIFGIQVGVAITFLVKNPNTPASERGLYYSEIPHDFMNRYERLDWLIADIERGKSDMKMYTKLEPQKDGRVWLTEGLQEDFECLIPLGTKEGKSAPQAEGVIFGSYGSGIKTNRDAWAYNFSASHLEKNMRRSINFFNQELGRYRSDWESDKEKNLDQFIAQAHDPTQMKWSLCLKNHFERLAKDPKHKETFQPNAMRISQYRPFLKKNLYFNRIWNNSVYRNFDFYPHPEAEKENVSIGVTGVGFRRQFSSLVCNKISSLDLFEKSQWFPLYTYSPLTGEPQAHEVTRTWGEVTYLRRENVTDWALNYFKDKLGHNDIRVTKENIFYYTYAVLNHPDYAKKYDRNLRGALARIGVVQTTHQFYRLVNEGKTLAKAILNYDARDPYPLKKPLVKDLPKHLKATDNYTQYRVSGMRLMGEKDGSPDYLRLKMNDWIYFRNIPRKSNQFKIEGRSPLEWFIKNFRRKTDKDSGLVDDPNEYQMVGAHPPKPDPFYAFELIPKLVASGLDAAIAQDNIAKVPLDWQEVLGKREDLQKSLLEETTLFE